MNAPDALNAIVPQVAYPILAAIAEIQKGLISNYYQLFCICLGPPALLMLALEIWSFFKGETTCGTYIPPNNALPPPPPVARRCRK